MAHSAPASTHEEGVCAPGSGSRQPIGRNLSLTVAILVQGRFSFVRVWFLMQALFESYCIHFGSRSPLVRASVVFDAGLI